MHRVDFILALITGEATAWLFYGLFKNLAGQIPLFGLILAVLFPILAVLGLWFSYYLGKRFLIVFQAAKFFLTGVLATLVYLGILNFLMWASQINKGIFFSVFAGLSFIVGTTAKYWGNKIWAFEKRETVGMGREFGKFFLVTIVGFSLNVGIASFIVNVIPHSVLVSQVIWANIGAILAAIISSAWNFLGYKFIVFRS